MAHLKSVVAALVLPALAVNAAPPVAASKPPLPGVYKHGFDNGDVSGDSFKSEDILEVTSYRPKVDYVRLHLDFYNGHLCDISGMAQMTPTALIYHGPKDSSGSPCTLTLAETEDGVHVFEDAGGACRNETCGERGGYGYDAAGPADFKLTERAPIRYMPRLVGSREYKAAVAEYQGRPLAP